MTVTSGFYKEFIVYFVDAAAESGSKDAAGEFQASQHVLVCALHELGSLVQALGTAANQLVSEPATGKS